MRTIVSFRLTNESGGTAAHVTERLRLQPTDAIEAGTPISRIPGRVRRQSIWILSSSPEPQDDVRLSAMLERLLEQLEPVKDTLWSLRQEGYRANWLCLLDVEEGEAATELTRETLQRFIALPGDLWIDVYKNTDADEEV